MNHTISLQSLNIRTCPLEQISIDSLERIGYIKVYHLLGQFLLFDKNIDQILIWLINNGISRKDAEILTSFLDNYANYNL